MKLTHWFFISILLLTLVLSIQAKPNTEDQEDDDHQELADPINDTQVLHGRFLSVKKLHLRRLRLTCNKFPRMCRMKGSPGPLCCKKRCVNVLTDRLNCGRCGKKCKYNEICCKGKCVNPSFNWSHCGGCNNGCKVGGFCAFGLCNYA